MITVAYRKSKLALPKQSTVSTRSNILQIDHYSKQTRVMLSSAHSLHGIFLKWELLARNYSHVYSLQPDVKKHEKYDILTILLKKLQIQQQA